MDHIEATRWQRLRRLLDQAIELDEGARRAWLVALRGNDEALRSELERLLARHDELRDRTLSTATALLALALAGDSSVEGSAGGRHAGTPVDGCVRGAADPEEACPVRPWLLAERTAGGE